jgi:small redox-active disulfide protein 2
MRKIEGLGSGCANCHRLAANCHRLAANAAEVAAEVVHVTDMREIARRGVMSTPGLAIDGQIVSTGRVASAADIAKWLTEQS